MNNHCQNTTEHYNAYSGWWLACCIRVHLHYVNNINFIDKKAMVDRVNRSLNVPMFKWAHKHNNNDGDNDKEK